MNAVMTFNFFMQNIISSWIKNIVWLEGEIKVKFVG